MTFFSADLCSFLYTGGYIINTSTHKMTFLAISPSIKFLLLFWSTFAVSKLLRTYNSIDHKHKYQPERSQQCLAVKCEKQKTHSGSSMGKYWSPSKNYGYNSMKKYSEWKDRLSLHFSQPYFLPYFYIINCMDYATSG